MNEITLSDNLKTDWRRARAFSKRGQFEYTDHENMIAAMFPELQRQVTFGTGKGGYKKWRTKKFTVDFLDEKNKVTDELKCRFLKGKDIEVVRIKNEKVAELFQDYLERRKVFERSFEDAIDTLF